MKPSSALSLDLDNHWSYLKIRGDERWHEYPSYLPRLVPTVLDELKRAGLRITFFIVGTDAAQARNRKPLRAIARAGHDIGNHSHRHESWMHRYTLSEVRDEIARAEAAIEKATGIKPRGFRGPGFALSPEILRVLAERDYAYDASTLPTFIGPLARAYYFRHSKLSPAQRSERATLFGDWRDGLGPNRPYSWRSAGHEDLLELPVTVMPGTRLPFHVSYLHYIAGHSRSAALAYFRTALALCKLSRTMPSLLLHPLDFLGAGEVEGLDFFPGMQTSGEKKRAFVRDVLGIYAQQFDVLAMDDAAYRVAFDAACYPERSERSQRPRGANANA